MEAEASIAPAALMPQSRLPASTPTPGQAAVSGVTRGMFTGLVLGMLWGCYEEKKFVLRNCLKVQPRADRPGVGWGWGPGIARPHSFASRMG